MLANISIHDQTVHYSLLGNCLSMRHPNLIKWKCNFTTREALMIIMPIVCFFLVDIWLVWRSMKLSWNSPQQWLLILTDDVQGERLTEMVRRHSWGHSRTLAVKCRYQSFTHEILSAYKLFCRGNIISTFSRNNGNKNNIRFKGGNIFL